MIGAAEPIYFGPQDGRCFGWYHATHAPARVGLVVCPPLYHEMLAAHRSLQQLALRAAAAGLPTLRFDYHGTGDSAGSDLDPGRLAAWLTSTRAACEALRRRSGVERVVLVGVRLGATLAAFAALQRFDVAGLVLWGPVGSGRRFLRESGALARFAAHDDMLAGLPEGAASASGFVVAPETVRELQELELEALDRRPARRVLIVPQEDTDTGAIADALRTHEAAVEVRELPGLAAMLRLPHEATVPTAIIDATVEWAGSLETFPGAGEEGEAPAGAAPGDPSRADDAVLALPDGVEEHPFTVGGRLFGILTRSGTAEERPAIILANAGAAYRIGVNRLYVTFARAWATLGFPVLRLDLGGLGDSLAGTGGHENEPYSAAAVDDVGEAAEALRVHLRARAVVVGGICSGAHAAFHAGRTLPGIAGVLMLNPVVFYWRPGDSLELEDWRTYAELRDDRPRAVWERWWRLLRGEDATSPAEDDAGRDLLRMCGDGKRILLLFSDGEPGLDFLRQHHPGELRRLAQCPGFRMEVIGTPGHNYPSVRAQHDVLERTTGHLLELYGAA